VRGGKVVVTIRDDKPVFECTPPKIPALLPAPDGMDHLTDDEEDEFLPGPVA
jgi:hypothetical protein